MPQKFSRKIYTFSLLLEDIRFMSKNYKDMGAAVRNKKIGKILFEKIMLVVTSVNGCRYCHWFHADRALSCGISNEEVKNMVKLQFDADCSDYELIALLYAQHYAETDRKPNEEMTQKLFEFYGDKTAKHIILIIRMIYFGNLSGNTFDAFLSRLKGQKAENSNILFEFIFSILSAPFLVLPILPGRFKNSRK